MTPREPTRNEMLEWLRYTCSDFRMQHRTEVSAARFTYLGTIYEIQATHEKIVRDAFEALREAMGAPVTKASDSRTLEPLIIAARFRGDHEQADRLEKEAAGKSF